MDDKQFGEIIKANLKSDTKFGYVALPVKGYEHICGLYYKSDEYSDFCKEMQEKYPAIFESYANGKGSELIVTPPKMASVASSSRFCYLALRNATISVFDEGNTDSQHFTFEKELPVEEIKKGTPPQMDAFLEANGTAWFFEFKVREIFDSKEKRLSKQYDTAFFTKAGITRTGERIPTSAFGLEDITRFDLKQFITHLTGIIHYGTKSAPKVFSYVYFKPKCAKQSDNVELQNIYDALTEEIKKVFASEKVRKICKDYSLELRLYIYENEIMDGFEKEVKPRRITL